MLMIRKYTPKFSSSREIEARRYAKRLVWPARIASALLAFPLTQLVAVIVSLALGLVVYVVGRVFRQHERELAAETPFLRRAWIMRRGFSFWLVSTIALGTALGQTGWLGWSHFHHEAVQVALSVLSMIEALLK